MKLGRVARNNVLNMFFWVWLQFSGFVRTSENMLSTLFLATLPSFIIFRSAWQTLFREIDIRDRCYKASVWSSIEGRFRSSHNTRKSQPDPKKHVKYIISSNPAKFHHIPISLADVI